MKTTKMLAILVLALGLLVWQAEVSKAEPMGMAWTYQGRLMDANKPADGLYDLQFKLFDDANIIDGNQVGSDVNKPDVDVIDGYFTVVLDFNDPNAFNGDARWLDVGVRPGEMNDPNVYTSLSPRQEVTPVPYALQTRGIFVDNAGNVGIGTTSPGEKLEVVGDVKVSGSGKGLIFPDGTKQTTAVSGAAVPSGFCILGETATAPPGYTYTGDRLLMMGTDIWQLKADMPTARYGLAAAAVNGKVYAIGGHDGSYLANNEEYDPATNTWAAKADMPTARYFLAAAALNGKIYAIGGHDGTSYLAKNEEYDPSTNTWGWKADMPTARGLLAAAAALNGKIYAIGGNDGTSYLATNEEYDPATNTWATKADMPTARYSLAAATALNGKIYAIGGFDGSSLAKNEEYDPTTNTWGWKADMPTARRMLAAAAVNGKVHAIGGFDGTSYLAKDEEYDPATNTWGWKADMPTARYNLAAAALNGKIYAIGGNDGSYLATNEEYTAGVAYYLQRKD